MLRNYAIITSCVTHIKRAAHCLRFPLISNYLIFKPAGTSFALLGSPSAANGDSSIGQQQCGQSKKKRSWSRAVFSNLQRKGLEKRFEVQKIRHETGQEATGCHAGAHRCTGVFNEMMYFTIIIDIFCDNSDVFQPFLLTLYCICICYQLVTCDFS